MRNKYTVYTVLTMLKNMGISFILYFFGNQNEDCEKKLQVRYLNTYRLRGRSGVDDDITVISVV